MDLKFLFVFGVIILTPFKCSGAPSTSVDSVISSEALFQGHQLYLTVSPLAGYKLDKGKTILLDRMLEIHWKGFSNLPRDSVAIFSANPAQMNSSELDQFILEKHLVTEGSGNVRTSIRYKRQTLSPTRETCLDFWIAYLQEVDEEKSVVMSGCLQIHPTWMNDIKNEIINTPLSSLMIPGTHNAGTWHHYAGAISDGPIIGYSYCQEDTIYDQLIHGIRSFDVRVGYYPLTFQKFFINHDVLVIRSLRSLLQDVRRFVLETNEIVFLDFHRFPVGLENLDNHRKLVAFLEKEIGDILAPKSLSLSATPGMLWELNRTVVLFYSHGEIEREYNFLWPGIRQVWAETNKMGELESYLEAALDREGCKGRAWSAMAQLTSTVEDIILRPLFGLRGLANKSNNEISDWYQRQRWYSRSMIVALDFYRSTNIVETAIEVNKNKANACF